VTKIAPFELPEPYRPPGFASLIPVHVQQTIDKFKSVMSDELAQISKTCHDSSDVVAGALEELNLPASLEALEPDAGLSSEAWARISAIQAEGGVEKLTKLHQEVVEAGKNSNKLYNDIREMLIVSSVDETMVHPFS
jgi:hypothetical protein